MFADVPAMTIIQPHNEILEQNTCFEGSLIVNWL